MNAIWGNLEEETRFMDGGEYRGTWNAMGMEGIGRFILPHGTAFEGEFRDGTFHGHGSTCWPRGQRIDGVWAKGECKDKRYAFNDGLIYVNTDWGYCQFPDRRYLTCIEHGLKPAGATLRTNNRDGFIIPPMCYDSGIGIFNPRTKCIASYRDSEKVIEIPNTVYTEWIKKNCQKAWSEPTGYREDLHENWFSPKFDKKILSGFLPFSSNSFECWWQRYSRAIHRIRNKHIFPGTVPISSPFQDCPRSPEQLHQEIRETEEPLSVC